MSSSFNPYQVWLGLGDLVTKPNYFELLGIAETEEDPRIIAAAADRAASRVRGWRPGEHAAEWAALLDQISAAKKCLTDPGRRNMYLQSLGGNQTESAESVGRSRNAGQSRSTRQSGSDRVPTRAPIDQNLYPPGLAPAMAPVSHSPAVNSPQEPSTAVRRSVDSRTAPSPSPAAHGKGMAGTSPATNPLSPQSPYVPAELPAAVAMQPFAATTPLSMSPAGVPYLQPVDSSGLTDPMHPAVAGMNANPYAPVASPLAPAPMDDDGAMAMVPAFWSPEAAPPIAKPIGTAAIPLAQALPYGATTYAMPTAAPAQLTPAATMPAVNQSSTAMLGADHARGGIFGPVVLGLGVGVVLLSIGGGYLYLRSTRGSSDSNQVASGDPASGSASSVVTTGQEQPAEPTIPPPSSPKHSNNSPSTALNSDVSPPSGNLQKQDDPSTEKPPIPESKPAVDPKPTTPESPSTTKPPEPTKPNAKPAQDAKTTPAVDVPAKTDEPPKPTKEELTKLGRALQKARDSIGAHEFDRAEAFISVASEMPRLPEHQAMLDRLKLLAKSVSDYRTAIQASIGKLAVASSFDVDNEPVIVVETGPEKVIFRMKGQNRAYGIRDLPFGLAIALAAQTLVDDDPNTLTLKGAYVMASPRASQEDLKKAREFLEKAAGSVDTAKELLLLLKDKYDLATGN